MSCHARPAGPSYSPGPMARLSEHGLRKSVGVSGMFATAYGNVGSSIYYALGLVAAHALGLTPLVFVFAGGLFALTAKTYAEGASMFPEAGGSSSFARHAFDDVVSFFAGWALSLDYILTIAISAFFVPHYLSAFPGLGALKHNPDDIFGGLIVVALLAWLNIRGLGESAKLNIVLALLDLSTQIMLAGSAIVLVLNPHLLINQVHLGSVPTWKELIFALSLAMLAYTGIETVANMAEESKDPGKQVPKAVNLVVLAVLGVYAGISVVALSALPVLHHGVGYSAELKQHLQNGRLCDRARRLLRKRPDARGRRTPGAARHRPETGPVLPRDPRRDDPVHRDQRRDDRDLAPVVVAIRAPPAAADVLAAALEVPHAVVHADLLLDARQHADHLRQHRSARQPLLVRRDALVHDRARGDREAARQRPRPRAPLPNAVGGAHQRRGDPDGRGDRRHRHVRRVDRRDRPAHRGEDRRHPVDGDRDGRLLLLPQTPGPEPAQELQDRARRSVRPDFEELEYKTALVPIFGDDVSASALSSAAKLIGAEGVVYAIYVLPVPSQLSLEAGLEEEEAHGRSVLESARIQARRAGIKIHTGLIRTRNPGAALVEEAERVGSDVIYWSTIHAPAGEQRIGPTATYLLSKRPCRVIIETENRPGRRAPARAWRRTA